MPDNQIIDSKIKILTTKYSNMQLPLSQYIEVDLGCGKGSFTTQLAEKYPERNIIAVDVMIGRLRKLTKRCLRLNINNLQTVKAEAWHFVCRCLPDNSIDRLHILCPDPWPKERHKGHRLISSEFVYRMSLKLKENGIFHFATDDISYYESALKVINSCDFFKQADDTIEDIRNLKSDFEVKWNEMGLSVNHSAWRKIL